MKLASLYFLMGNSHYFKEKQDTEDRIDIKNTVYSIYSFSWDLISEAVVSQVEF